MKHPRILDANGVPVGSGDKPRSRFRDGLQTFDRRTIDSTGSFLIGELERLDQTLHEPLVDVVWPRDIDLREDVTVADEVSSFTNSTFASSGGINPNGISWIGKDATTVASLALDIGKTAQPLNLWGQEVSYTIPELESAMKLGRPVDAQKYAGMKLKHQMDTDQMVFIGDSALNIPGLVNANSIITPYTVAKGAQNSTLWTTKTPDEILADVDTLINAAWQAAAWAVVPNCLRLPPFQFSWLVSQKVSNAGNMSILKYIQENNLAAQKGQKLTIDANKWLIGQGVGGTPLVLNTVDRMMAYTRDPNRVRYPMTMLGRTPLEYRSIWHITTYYGRLGQMEFVYPETIAYADGI